MRFLKARGIIGILVEAIPGEFASCQEKVPPVGYLEGREDIFTILPTERIIKMECMAGIVLEQIR